LKIIFFVSYITLWSKQCLVLCILGRMHATKIVTKSVLEANLRGFCTNVDEDPDSDRALGFEFVRIWVLKTSVLDPGPCGSVLKWLPWIRIRIGNTDPDPGQSEWCPEGGGKSGISS